MNIEDTRCRPTTREKPLYGGKSIKNSSFINSNEIEQDPRPTYLPPPPSKLSNTF